MAYTVGAKYIQNTTTKVVFPYEEKLIGLPNLEVVIATDANTVSRDLTTMERSPLLNPTMTPEKAKGTQTVVPAPPAKRPTLLPVDEPV